MQLIRRSNTITVLLWVLVLHPFDALAWNIPGHMLSGAIAYQILQRENPSTITTVRSVLENNPWYESRWKSQLEKPPQAQRDEMLFMLATRWADDIRTKDRALSYPLWHHISWPFKPQGEPETVHTMPPEAQNIVTAIVLNEAIHSLTMDFATKLAHAGDLIWQDSAERTLNRLAAYLHDAS